MKLYIMKREALETLKANLKSVYAKYYTESSNKWIAELCGEDPFVEFKDIPKFELADLSAGLTPGEIDIKNCKILYEKLMFLSESQASDERLWAGLTHGTFYNYMRQRWGYGYGKKPKNAEKEAGAIKTRFFYSSGIRSGFYRNTLAKCWWVGRNTYDAGNATNHFERLDIIGSNDINSKITEIFYNYTFSSNSHVLDSIIDAFKYFKDEGITLSVREHIRPTMQKINAMGGSVVIDCLSAEEITDAMVNNIQGIMQGDASDISVEDENDEILENDDSILDDEVEQVEDDSSELEVTLGCKVVVKDEDGNTTTYKYDYVNGNIPILIRPLEGLHAGAEVMIGRKSFVIEKVYL